MNMQILNYSLGLIEDVMIFTFGNAFFVRKYKSCVPWLLTVMLCSILVYCTSDFNIVIKSIIGIFELLIGFSFLYKEKMHIKTAIAITLLYILYAVDIVVGNFVAFVFDEQLFVVFYGTFINRFIICLTIKVINAILYLQIYKMFFKIKYKSEKNYWLMYNIIAAVFMIISILFLYMDAFAETTIVISIAFFLISLAFLIMSLIVMHFFSELTAHFYNEKRLYILESSYSSIKDSLAIQSQDNLKMKKVRHDIKNHINNIMLLWNDNSSDKAYKLLEEVSSYVNNIGVQLIQATGNSLIDSIVLYKATLCENKNIEFHYILENLPKLNIDLLDISAVFSNILDNAIEATEKADKPFIEIKVFIYKCYLSVIVSNSFSEKINIQNGKLVTQKSDNQNHGYGTMIINEICEKYDGTYNWNIYGNLFVTNVIMKYE